MKKLLMTILILGSSLSAYATNLNLLEFGSDSQILEETSHELKKSATVALKAHRKWQRNHKEERKNFFEVVKTIKSDLNTNGEIAQIYSEINKKCSADSLCDIHSEQSQVIDAIKKKFHHSGLSLGLARGCSSDWVYGQVRDDGHYVVAGWRTYECNDESSATIYTIGPGLLGAIGASVFVCLMDNSAKKSYNVGASVSGALLAGAQAGVYLGMNGLCLELGAQFGLGASAGLSLLKFEK